jgi:hypothetical protein
MSVADWIEGFAVRDLVVAVVGGIIVTALNFFYSVGFQWTTRSRQVRRQQRDAEIADWKSGDTVKRQRLFNIYLFSVLKLFIIGNILTGIATALSDLEPNEPGINNFDFILTAVDAIGVLFYFATFAKILQFTKLLRTHP